MADKEKVVDWDEVGEPSEHVVHPEGYECMFIVESVKAIREEEKQAIVLIGDCDGAKVREHIGLTITEKRTREFIFWKLCDPMTAFGMRKHGDKSTPNDLLKCTGKRGLVSLTRKSFISDKSGKTLWNNEVAKWIEPGNATKPTTAAKPATTTAPTSAQEAIDASEPDFG